MALANRHVVLPDFWRWQSQSWVQVVRDVATDEKANFMPLNTLKTYFEADGSRVLCQILAELFGSDDYPIHPELILRGHTAIFCILLCIGRGILIEHFACYEELSDQRLPFDQNQPPPYFPAAVDDSNLLQRFCEKQWMYCVPIFDRHMLNKHFGRQRLLPITEKEKHGEDGKASIYKIKIYTPNNKLVPPKQAQGVISDTFILKRYTKEGENQYMKEISSFRNLKHPDSIVRFCGSYTHGDDYNILIEYADKRSLEEYFQNVTPPSRGADIIKFWEGLFKLLDALRVIHSVLGSHQNIKPGQVLVLSYGATSPVDWKFKLANFGQSNTDSKDPKEEEVPVDNAKGPQSYGAPECSTPYHLHDTRAADVWSLGCLFSEAAMWIAGGYSGLTGYRRRRKAETGTVPNFKGGDCFHDGEKLLKSVVEAHASIEETLRRSDYITKDVLDSMVDEMLWEEDRPKARALLRKSEGVLARARQRLPSNTGDDIPTPPYSNGQPIPLPRFQPPQIPLPELPRGAPKSLTSIPRRQYPPNVENWRSQVSGSQISESQYSDPISDVSSPTYSRGARSATGSASDLDRELNGSIESWQINDNSSLASPITPFASPHPSVCYSSNGNFSPEVRPRPLYSQHNQHSQYFQHSQSQRPSDNWRNNSFPPHRLPYAVSESETVPSSTTEVPVKFVEHRVAMPPPVDPWRASSGVDDSRTLIDDSGETTRKSSGTYSVSILGPRSRNGSLPRPVSQDTIESARKSQKRAGFTLFPQSGPKGPSRMPSFFSNSSKPSVRRDCPSPMSRPQTALSSAPMTAMPIFSESLSADYLSVNTTLEWKRAHKKVKKEKVPLLPGMDVLEELKERDHVFIIDDSASMEDCWPGVTRVFEALSYVVKGWSPEGTDLFYTVSYDTWRRRDTSDLCEYLEKVTVGGQTDINYRLNLQLQSYRAKIASAIPAKSKKNKLRPLSFYILTNGAWEAGADPKATIKEMVDFLASPSVNLTDYQVTIQFISFAANTAALQRMNDLVNEDFGLDILDCTPWTGNVLKMLGGPLYRKWEEPTEPLEKRGISAGMWGGGSF